jgi:hypothetical protein
VDGEILKCLCENAEKLGKFSSKDPRRSRNTPTWKVLKFFGIVEGDSQFNFGGMMKTTKSIF